MGWHPVKDRVRHGIAICNYLDPKDQHLQLTVGDAVIVLEECEGWYFGQLAKNTACTGVFPKTFIHIQDPKSNTEGRCSSIIQEATAVLRDWRTILRDKYLARDTKQFTPLENTMREIMNLRAGLIGGKMTVEEAKEYQKKVTTKIDFMNNHLKLDLVVRNPDGSVLSPEKVSAVSLYRNHVKSAEQINTMLGTKLREETESSNSFKILMTVKNFVCSKITEEVDMVFSIYEVALGKTPKPLCESYIVEKWSRNGLDLERRNNLRVLFSDISKNDIANKKLYLICNILGDGNYCNGADQNEKKIAKSFSKQDMSKIKSKDINFHKPVGVAAIEITDLFTFKQGKNSDRGCETELGVPFIPSHNDSETLEKTFEKHLERKSNSDSQTQKLWVSLHIMLGDQNPLSDDGQKRSSTSNGRQGALVARKIGLPEIILPSDTRNDLYVTLVSGEFARLEKRQDRNIEITVEVCDHQGLVMDDAITGGVGSSLSSCYRSTVYYHDGKPKWNEVTRVSLPVTQFENCHLRFTFRHRSRHDTKERPVPYAIAFLKLVNENDGTAIKDGMHELLVFKIEKKFDIQSTVGSGANARVSYLDLQDLKSKQYLLKQQSMNNLKVIKGDLMVVQTMLCSTKLTQNEGLLSLLKWRSEPQKLNENLQIFKQKVNGDEVVKFLADVLDALFSILMENTDQEQYDNKVFKNFIHVLQMITEAKYQHFIPVLELYIQETFSWTLAYNKLLVVLKDCVEMSSVCPKEVTEAMKALKYIFKFVVRSRYLFSELNGGKGREPFEQMLKDVLQCLVKLMFSSSPDLFQAQAFCLRNMVQSIPDLITVFDRTTLAEIIMKMITSLPKTQLSEQKMATIRDLIHSDLFVHAECRLIILPEATFKIKEMLENTEEHNPTQHQKLIPICTETLGDMLDSLFDVEKMKTTPENISEIMLTCLRTVIKGVANRKKDDRNVGAIVANMIELFRNMSPMHYLQYIEHFNVNEPAGRSDLLDFIMEVLGMFRDLVQHNIFPQDWVTMILLQNSVIMDALRQISNTIRDYFTLNFEYQAWSNFFMCAITFLTQSSLQLETFSENKRHKIYGIYKDMRKEMGLQIKSMWFNLGQHKIRFIPEMVGPFLEMTLIPEPDLRKATIPIFFDMMQFEYYSPRFRGQNGEPVSTKRDSSMTRGNFFEFEREMIEKLDVIIEGGGGDEYYKDLFHQLIMGLCENHTAMRESGTKFVALVTRLMELLLEYRAIAQEESKENQMSCIVNLMDFYKNIRRDEMYVRYLKKLSCLHEECSNWAEAAYTLLEYSKLLHWNDSGLKFVLSYRERHPTCRTHRELKEQLYKDIIHNFEKGKMWENALRICKELVIQYEEETFEYTKMAELLQRMAKLYQNIMDVNQLRPEPEYFRVAFYGRGFPAFLQNKVFIYRGKGYERLKEFQTRMLDQFPNAELMKTLEMPSEEEREQPVQLLQINKVDPVMEEKKRFQGKHVSQQIINYYKVNEINRFMYSRPYHKDKEKDNEFASLWIERTVMQTTSSFPGILQWFPLAKAPEVYHLCPLEVALETMHKANEDLRCLILEHQNPNPPLNPLSMKLKGIIDAAVMGGTANYEKAFFTDKYTEDHPEHDDKIKQLQNLIADQIPLLHIGIRIHDAKKSDDLKPFHDRLELMFNEMKTHVEEKYGKRTSDISFSKRLSNQRKSSAALERSNGSRGSITSDIRTSYASSTLDLGSASKPRGSMFNVLSVGLKRNKSSALKEDRRGNSASNFYENGHDDSPTFLITQHSKSSRPPSRPSSGQFFIPSTPPTHSRSPSISSNRDSMISNDGSDPPAVPPKFKSASDLAENASLCSFEEERFPDREDLVEAQNIVQIKPLKKKAPPPPPPTNT